MGTPIPKTVTWASPATLDFLKVLWIFFPVSFSLTSRFHRSLGRCATSLKLAFSERPTCSKSTVTLTQIAKVIWQGDAYMTRVLGNGDVHITVTAAGKGQNISLLSPRAFSQPNNWDRSFARSRSGNPLSRQRCSLGPWRCLQFLCSVFGQLSDWSLFSYSSRRKLVEVCRCRQNFCSWSWCMTMTLRSDLPKAWNEDCASCSYSLKTNSLYYVSKPVLFILYYLVMQGEQRWQRLTTTLVKLCLMTP